MHSASPVRLVIADDHPIFRDGLRKLLESESDLRVIGEATDGVQALELVRTLVPDVLLLDLAMPRLGGLESLAELDESGPLVVVLTAAITEASRLRALQLGARAVLSKDVASRELLLDLRRAIAGQYVVGDQTFTNRDEAVRQTNAHRTMYVLTPRERDIVAAVLEGRSNREIARDLAISVQTVKHHLTSIFDKTGASSRLELALFAAHHQLLDRA